MNVVGYIRVSTDEQVREGMSLEAQKSKIQAWAHAMEFKLIALEEDAGISGKSITAREGLKRLWSLLAHRSVLVSTASHASPGAPGHTYGGGQTGQSGSRSGKPLGTHRYHHSSWQNGVQDVGCPR